MNEFVSISELTQSREDKINSKDLTQQFLFDSSDMSQIAVCTLGSLIDRGCGIVWILEKISKTKLIVGGRGSNSREGWKRVKIVIANGRVGFEIAFFFPFLTIIYTILRIFVYTVK